MALLLTAVLFALAHGTQNFPLFFDRFAFGLIAGWLVILVGGLEAGIALHILNNLLAFGVAIAFGDLAGRADGLRGVLVAAAVTIAQNGVFLLLVLLVARRMGLSQTRTGARRLPSRRAGPLAGSPRARQPAAEDGPAPIGGRRGVCVFLTVGPPRTPAEL